MTPERRTHARRVLYSPEYLDMGTDNGGMVVNLSEGGMGFQAVNPVAPQTEIPISFSLASGYRIDVKARVAWVNNTGKIGGVVFGKLSKDSLSLIREWVAQTKAEEDSDGTGVVTAIAEKEEHASCEVALASVAPASETSAVIAEAIPASEIRVEPSVCEKEPSAKDSRIIPPSPEEKLPELAFAQPTAEESAAPPTQDAHNATPQATRDSSAVQEAAPPVAPIRPLYEELPSSPPKQERAPAPVFQPRAISVPLQKRERQSPGSFSVVPSISTWGGRAASESPVKQSPGPLFPPRSAENIFARSPSQSEAQREKSASARLFVFGIVIAAAAVGAFYVRTHRQAVGTVIAHIGNRVAGNPDPSSGSAMPPRPGDAAASNSTNVPIVKQQSSPAKSSEATTQAIKPTQTSPSSGAAKEQVKSAAGAAELSLNAAKASTPSGALPRAPRPAAAKVPAASMDISHGPTPAANSSSPSLASSLAGQSEYQRAEQYLNGKGVPRDYGEAAQWFWRSLEAGYTDAALPLANLYLDGHGVSRSCTQARILLDAAAQKNNAQAIQKLAQLPENCQ